MFPTTDDSHTIIDCLTKAATDLRVKWRTHCGVTQITKSNRTYELLTSTGDQFTAQNILVATGGIRSKDARIPAEDLNHELSSPVPSLFTFKINDPRIHGLQGVSVPHATASTDTHQSEGPLLITHWGLSGPAILKISAWGARDLSQSDYRFSVTINWTGNESRGFGCRRFLTTTGETMACGKYSSGASSTASANDFGNECVKPPIFQPPLPGPTLLNSKAKLSPWS